MWRAGAGYTFALPGRLAWILLPAGRLAGTLLRDLGRLAWSLLPAEECRVHFCVTGPAGLEPTAGRGLPGTLLRYRAGWPGAYCRPEPAGYTFPKRRSVMGILL
jgi:hypothetical protein